MSFETLGLEPELLRAVADKGYTVATPIQLQAIPAVLSGRDVLAGAQTGTGKTAGFVLPLLQKLQRAEGRLPRVLVLTPTRELAAQIAESARDYGAHKDLRTQVIFGGVGERPQIDGLRAGCDILIATPGRLIDLAEQGAANLSGVKYFVLDEADRMLDMGFIQPIRRVMRMLPAQRQNLMFSATYSDQIRALASSILKDPVSVEVAPRNTTAERVSQLAYRIPKEHKRHLLVHLFQNGAATEGPWAQVLVFTRTKHGANRLAEQLAASGIHAAAIHGNKSQTARERALADFKAGRVRALVATEIASRGLDIKELPHVVNYELPNVPEDYVHRIGRTARAGSSGSAVSLVSPDEAPLLRDIERTMRRTIPFTPNPAFSMVEPPRSAATPARDERPSLAPQGRQLRGGGGGGRTSGPGCSGGGGGPAVGGRPARGPRAAGEATFPRSAGGGRPRSERPFGERVFDGRPQGERPRTSGVARPEAGRDRPTGSYQRTR